MCERNTYWNNVNFLDYQSKDSNLNPNVNDPIKCPVKEQDYNDCEAKYGTNAKECDKLMHLYVNGCKNDDVVLSCSDPNHVIDIKKLNCI